VPARTLRLSASASSWIVAGMFMLLAAQLSWWLVFFRMTQEETSAIEQALDRERIYRLQGTGPAPASDTVSCQNGVCFIKPEVIKAREAQHRRRLSMLLSETLFVLSVLSYGSFRVIRSIQAEKKLNEERITFLNSVTHELKTPVASVQLMLQTLEKRKLPEAQKQELMSEAVSSLRRLSSQIEDLLLAGEVGRTREKDFRCNASLCTQDAVLRHRAMGTRVEAELAPGLFVALPESLMARMLDILIGNAALHGASDQPVELRLQQEGAHAVLRVRDHGEGIPAGQEKMIFRAFHRASRHSGTGLGLYLARQIAQMAGGGSLTQDIMEARNHPKGGAEFTVRLRLLTGENA
jgi:signal transduction histidine kinase